jgi:hypothetical protein
MNTQMLPIPTAPKEMTGESLYELKVAIRSGFIHEGKLMIPHRSGNIIAPLAIPVSTGTPTASWTGKKIPLSDWYRVVAFFQDTYNRLKGECYIRLFYHERNGEFLFSAPPQVVKPAHVEVTETPEWNEEQARLHSNGWMEVGSIHSHASMAAFQSGTDSHSEKDRPGVHITIGKFNQQVLDIHGRMSFDGVMYNIVWSQWFDIGIEVPPKYAEQITQDMLKCDPEAGVLLKKKPELKFPAAWREAVKEPPPIQHTQYGLHGHGEWPDHHYQGYHQGFGNSPGVTANGVYWEKKGDGKWEQKPMPKPESKTLSKKQIRRMKKKGLLPLDYNGFPDYDPILASVRNPDVLELVEALSGALDASRKGWMEHEIQKLPKDQRDYVIESIHETIGTLETLIDELEKLEDAEEAVNDAALEAAQMAYDDGIKLLGDGTMKPKRGLEDHDDGMGAT